MNFWGKKKNQDQLNSAHSWFPTLGLNKRHTILLPVYSSAAEHNGLICVYLYVHMLEYKLLMPKYKICCKLVQMIFILQPILQSFFFLGFTKSFGVVI